MHPALGVMTSPASSAKSSGTRSNSCPLNDRARSYDANGGLKRGTMGREWGLPSQTGTPGDTPAGGSPRADCPHGPPRRQAAPAAAPAPGGHRRPEDPTADHHQPPGGTPPVAHRPRP